VLTGATLRLALAAAVTVAVAAPGVVVAGHLGGESRAPVRPAADRAGARPGEPGPWDRPARVSLRVLRRAAAAEGRLVRPQLRPCDRRAGGSPVRWRRCAFHALARLTMAGGTNAAFLRRLAGASTPPPRRLVLTGELANGGYTLGDTARSALYGAGSASWPVALAGSRALQRLGAMITRLAGSSGWARACGRPAGPVA
jgi:hypothetical protein